MFNVYDKRDKYTPWNHHHHEGHVHIHHLQKFPPTLFIIIIIIVRVCVCVWQEYSPNAMTADFKLFIQPKSVGSMLCQGLFEAQKPSGKCQTLALTELPLSGGVRQQTHKLVKYFNEITLSSNEHKEEDKTGSQDGAWRADATFRRSLYTSDVFWEQEDKKEVIMSQREELCQGLEVETRWLSRDCVHQSCRIWRVKSVQRSASTWDGRSQKMSEPTCGWMAHQRRWWTYNHPMSQQFYSSVFFHQKRKHTLQDVCKNVHSSFFIMIKSWQQPIHWSPGNQLNKGWCIQIQNVNNTRKWSTYTHNLDAAQKPMLGGRSQTQKNIYCRIPE